MNHQRRERRPSVPSKSKALLCPVSRSPQVEAPSDRSSLPFFISAAATHESRACIHSQLSHAEPDAPESSPVCRRRPKTMTSGDDARGISHQNLDRQIPAHATRDRLPSAVRKADMSIWNVLKHMVGKDLTRFAVPILFNEPLSFLQRLAEYMEYAPILADAASSTDPLRRIELVGAFALSSLSANAFRLSKPFNPLWFETFELDRSEDLGYRFVAEQVSHHPPVSAFHASSDDWEFFGNVSPRLRFWGTSIECQPKAMFTVRLKKHNETYTWEAASISIHNLIMGEMYMDVNGTTTLQCRESGYQSKITFKKRNLTQITFKKSSSWTKSGPDFHFEGEISHNKNKIKALYGSWATFLASAPYATFYNKETHKAWVSAFHKCLEAKSDDVPLVNGSEILWKTYRKPQESSQYYNMTYFALSLNEKLKDPTATERLPPTDCRLRPDMRLMEDGDIDSAADEKHRLEEKQRAARQRHKEAKATVAPSWFEPENDEYGRGESWRFTGTYWKRGFGACQDIF
uniref:Oxysterol-binding protein n=1 Tax=Steinernema glaseri TaxID=37863 RepID=A0A1I7Z646_9BILA